MMTEVEWQALKTKIEREFPVRLRLAVLAGRPPVNTKNRQALMDFDATIAELLTEVSANKPENLEEAQALTPLGIT
jgi:hypothetical protein